MFFLCFLFVPVISAQRLPRIGGTLAAGTLRATPLQTARAEKKQKAYAEKRTSGNSAENCDSYVLGFNQSPKTVVGKGNIS